MRYIGWSVSHDIVGFIKLFPSTQSFQGTLESFLANHVAYHEKFGSAAPNPYFWAGNEHDFLAPFLFNYGTDCTRTQYWTRRLTYMHYSNTPHGIPGNEDYGAMSTWLMFTTLGLFPQAGMSIFLLGSPRIASASIDLKRWDGHVSTLTIKTVNNSADNVYVQKLLVNGREWHSPSISRTQLMAKNGVTLEFYMQAEPASGLCAK
jgi:putative alpha-1,2-mannosidase